MNRRGLFHGLLGNVGHRRIDFDRLFFGVDDEVHVLHRNRAQQDIGISRQNDCINTATSVRNPNLHRADNVVHGCPTIREFRQSLVHFEQTKLVAN